MKNPHPNPSPETLRLCEEAKTWFNTHEGRERIAEVLRRAAIQSRKFREDGRVDPATLRIPMDI
jgi:hypothetical protein